MSGPVVVPVVKVAHRTYEEPHIIRTESDASTSVLRLRAEGLRRTAQDMHPLVANAYRRRASELEFEAWLTLATQTDQADAAA